MDNQSLRILVENELYKMVLANSQDKLENVTISTVRNALLQFMKRYEKKLTIENIDYATEYIWTLINKSRNKSANEKEK